MNVLNSNDTADYIILSCRGPMLTSHFLVHESKEDIEWKRMKGNLEENLMPKISLHFVFHTDLLLVIWATNRPCGQAVVKFSIAISTEPRIISWIFRNYLNKCYCIPLWFGFTFLAKHTYCTVHWTWNF